MKDHQSWFPHGPHLLPRLHRTIGRDFTLYGSGPCELVMEKTGKVGMKREQLELSKEEEKEEFGGRF